jgi:hypothetical protein
LQKTVEVLVVSDIVSEPALIKPSSDRSWRTICWWESPCTQVGGSHCSKVLSKRSYLMLPHKIMQNSFINPQWTWDECIARIQFLFYLSMPQRRVKAGFFVIPANQSVSSNTGYR